MLVFVRPNSGYVRPKLKVIGQMSCQVKYLFAALQNSFLIKVIVFIIEHKWIVLVNHAIY
jgi:hypothetical protein